LGEDDGQDDQKDEIEEFFRYGGKNPFLVDSRQEESGPAYSSTAIVIGQCGQGKERCFNTKCLPSSAFHTISGMGKLRLMLK
jgi:hypothetical protein